MVCPSCGEYAHRSRSRNFRESFLKYVSPLRPYRCPSCGWRGYAAPARINFAKIDRRAVFVWIAGMLLAVAVGFFGAGMAR
ncbi:MAG: hypothetical protein JMDDDDMK_03898 [Acidobacteria bacterium]|nr:hypothetical protein [Acidobacteriota bacterium]